MAEISRRKLISLGVGLMVGTLAGLPGSGYAQSAPKFGLPFQGEPSLGGWRMRQWYGNTQWAYRQRRALYSSGQGLHFGLDFFAPCGTAILAIGNGTVLAIDGPYGAAPHNLLISHPNGYVSLYGHLQERAKLRIGQKVQQGELVAFSGAPTGADCDTHPHLHLEIRPANLGGTVNPINLIEADWYNLALGLPGEGLLFQVNLDEPDLWQTIFDQPQVRFGGSLLNDFAHPWPIR